MASIQFVGKTPKEVSKFVGKMYNEKKAILRPVGEPFNAIRMSMAYYNIEDEYEQFFKLVETEM